MILKHLNLALPFPQTPSTSLSLSWKGSQGSSQEEVISKNLGLK